MKALGTNFLFVSFFPRSADSDKNRKRAKLESRRDRRKLKNFLSLEELTSFGIKALGITLSSHTTTKKPESP
jgi:hypothetical protein